MTPAAAATAIRAAIEESCRKDPAYRTLVERELQSIRVGQQSPEPTALHPSSAIAGSRGSNSGTDSAMDLRGAVATATAPVGGRR